MTAGFHPLAADELADAAVSYEKMAAGLGNAFLNEIERLVQVVVSYPDLGRPQSAGVRTVPARRFPYTLVYQLIDQRPYVLAIAHQRREPHYWTARQR